LADDAATASFDTLPADVLSRVADHLMSTDHLALQAVPNRHLVHSIEHHVLAAEIEHRHAPAVHTLAEFVALMGRADAAAPGTVASLPPTHQASALSALAQRVPALQLHERGPATHAFLAFPYQGPRHALLDELRHAATIGDMGLVNRELALTQFGRPAHIAVAGGQPIGRVAAAHGIVSPEAMGNLRIAALHHAQLQIAQERHVPTVAREAGLDHPADRALLNAFASAVAGPAMVRRGMEPEAVIEQLGIVGPQHRLAVQRAAAERDAERGMNVQATAVQYGVVGDAAGLELIAATHVGVDAVERGEGTVREVAARLGIVSNQGIVSFEAMVVAGPGLRALMANDDAQAVAQRFDLQLPQSQVRLAELQAWVRQRDHRAEAA